MRAISTRCRVGNRAAVRYVLRLGSHIARFCLVDDAWRIESGRLANEQLAEPDMK